MTIEPDAGNLHIAEQHRAEHPGMWLRLPCCEGSVHPVRIQSQDDGRIVITVPSEPHADWVKRPEPHQVVTLGWTDTGGTLVLECNVEQTAETGWTLRVLSTQDMFQRRRHIRVSSDAFVQLMGGDLANIISGQVCDISESGMRVSFEGWIPEVRTMPYQFALHLDDTTVVVMCELRWTGRTGPLEVQAGFEFIETYESLLTRLRSYVMKQLDTRGPLAE